MAQWGDDAYILVDCPGQVELYAHLDSVKKVSDTFTKWGYSCCAIFCLEAHCLLDDANDKLLPVLLVSLAAMMRLALPHLNMLTMVDVLPNKDSL